MINKIRRHLELAKKGYFEHMFFAMKIGLKCLWSFVTAFVHAINPAWFEYTTSKRIKRMNDLFQKVIVNEQDKIKYKDKKLAKKF